MSSIFGKLRGVFSTNKQPKFKVYQPGQLKIIAMKTRIILQTSLQQLQQTITIQDRKFKFVGQDPKQIYNILQQIGQKIIQAESIKIFVEMMRKIETNSAQIVRTNGDISLMKTQLLWFQSILWYRRSREINNLQELYQFCLNFFKGVDVTQELNIKCQVFQIYPILKYLKKGDILPIQEILYYIQPYVSCNITKPTLEEVFVINKDQINKKAQQITRPNRQSDNIPAQRYNQSNIQPNSAIFVQPEQPNKYFNPSYQQPINNSNNVNNIHQNSYINPNNNPYQSNNQPYDNFKPNTQQYGQQYMQPQNIPNNIQNFNNPYSWNQPSSNINHNKYNQTQYNPNQNQPQYNQNQPQCNQNQTQYNPNQPQYNQNQQQYNPNQPQHNHNQNQQQYTPNQLHLNNSQNLINNPNINNQPNLNNNLNMNNNHNLNTNPHSNNYSLPQQNTGNKPFNPNQYWAGYNQSNLNNPQNNIKPMNQNKSKDAEEDRNVQKKQTYISPKTIEEPTANIKNEVIEVPLRRQSFLNTLIRTASKNDDDACFILPSINSQQPSSKHDNQREPNDYEHNNQFGSQIPLNRDSYELFQKEENMRKAKEWEEQEKIKEQERIKKKDQEKRRAIQEQIMKFQREEALERQRKIKQKQKKEEQRQKQEQNRLKQQEQLRIKQQNQKIQLQRQQKAKQEREEQQKLRKQQQRQSQRQERQNEVQLNVFVDNEREEIDRGNSGRFSMNMNDLRNNFGDLESQQFSNYQGNSQSSSIAKFQKQQHQHDNEIPLIEVRNEDEQQSLSIIRANKNKKQKPFKLFYYKMTEAS